MDSDVGYDDEPELVSINLFVYHDNFTPLPAIPVSLTGSFNGQSDLFRNVTDLTGHTSLHVLEEDCLNLQSININKPSSLTQPINHEFSSSIISRKLIEPFCNSFGPPDERILYVKLGHVPQAEPHVKPHSKPAAITPETDETHGSIHLDEDEQPVVLIVTLILLFLLSFVAAVILRRCCKRHNQSVSDDLSSLLDDEAAVTDVIEHKHEVTLSESVEAFDLDKLVPEDEQSNNQIVSQPDNPSNSQLIDEADSPATPVQETVSMPLIQPIVIRETFAWRSGQAPRVNIQR